MYIQELKDKYNIQIKDGKPLSTTEILRDLIRSDYDSYKKQLARKALQYSITRNDIKDIDFRKYFKKIGERKLDSSSRGSSRETTQGLKSEPILQEAIAPLKANNRIASNYFSIAVEQATDFAVNESINFSFANKEIEDKQLSSVLAQFNLAMTDVLDTLQYNGSAGLFFFYSQSENSKNTINFKVCPGTELIVLTDENTGEINTVIRYYFTDFITRNQIMQRFRVEVWTDTEVIYYQEDENFNLIYEKTLPHFFTMKLSSGKQETIPNAFGKIPFAYVEAKYGLSELEKVKSTIDSLDKVWSLFINQIEDLKNSIIHLAGAMGQDAYQLLYDIMNANVLLSDSDGKASVLNLPLQVDAYKTAFSELRREFFINIKGVNIYDPEVTKGNRGSEALKILYEPLISKIKRTYKTIDNFIETSLYFISFDYLNKSKRNLTPQIVYDFVSNFDWEYKISNPVNEKELSDIISNAVEKKLLHPEIGSELLPLNFDRNRNKELLAADVELNTTNIDDRTNE